MKPNKLTGLCSIIFAVAGVVWPTFATNCAASNPTGEFQPGRYSPVAKADLPAMKFAYYFDVNDKHHEADFTWTFTTDKFKIASKKGPVAAEILKKIKATAKAPKTIEGKWFLETSPQGGTTLSLTDMRVDDMPFSGKATYNIYRTAPTVIRIGEPQYVFGL